MKFVPTTIERKWAFLRRAQYIGGASLFLLVLMVGSYFAYFYTPGNCFDNRQNGDERGVDCGGGCTRVCSFDIMAPKALWSRSFEITDGQYNAVAYVENNNMGVGSPEVAYTFKLYDNEGLITERSGVTVLPPDSTYPIFEGRIDTGNRTPTQTFIELDTQSAVWLPADAGREQFVVESRSLTGAGTAPRLNARMTNTAIEEARDVEIVATIFDSKGTALTASRTIVPIFGGRATQDVVFTWPEPIAATLRSCEVPTDVVLAVDLSGSMNDDGGTPPEPITSVLSAASAFVNRLKTQDQVSVVTFATDATTNVPFSSSMGQISSLIQGLTIAPASEVGSTNTGDAIKLATAEMQSDRHNANARKVTVLLTDGLANAPKGEPEQYALDAAATLKETDTQVFTIGLGSNVNETFLREIASSPSMYYFAPSARTVDQIYRSITAAICEDGPAVIEIVPKTPTTFDS